MRVEPFEPGHLRAGGKLGIANTVHICGEPGAVIPGCGATFEGPKNARLCPACRHSDRYREHRNSYMRDWHRRKKAS